MTKDHWKRMLGHPVVIAIAVAVFRRTGNADCRSRSVDQGQGPNCGSCELQDDRGCRAGRRSEGYPDRPQVRARTESAGPEAR